MHIHMHAYVLHYIKLILYINFKVRSHQKFPLEISGGNGYRGNF